MDPLTGAVVPPIYQVSTSAPTSRPLPATALDQADRVRRARLGEDAANGDERLHSLALMLGMACRNAAEGNLYQATVPLACCEILAQRL